MDNNTKVPVHVSIIMDGNGRWARERGQERVFGHKNGIASVRASLKAAAEAGVKYLSLYAFSEENWDRPREEVDYLMKLMFQAISDEMEEMMRNGVRFRVLGNRARLSPVLLDAIVAMEEATRDNTTIDLIIFYLGGEIIDGIRNTDSISQLTHVVGGALGMIFGFLYRGRRRR